jgi:hypothetical protein
MKSLSLKHFLIVAVILCGTFAAKAQTTAPATAAKPAAKTAAAPAAKGVVSYIETFFKKYKTSSDSAVDYIFGTNKLFTNVSQINVLKAKLDSLQISLGPFIGRELIAEKSATNSLVIYSYIVKHENQPIRFIFMFYKPHNDWELYRFNYDDGMDVEMLEAVKINNKKQ